nr:oligosaccharide flippase family protein [uncultured Solibaculum sp.]
MLSEEQKEGFPDENVLAQEKKKVLPIRGLLEKYRHIPIQVKASFWFLICSFLQKGISMITTPIFTRLLSTAEYGQYNVFNSWLGIVTIFVSLNLAAGVYTQGLIKFEKEGKVYSSSLQGLTVVLCFSWTVIYLLFRDFWNDLFSLTTVQMLAMLVMIWTTAVFKFWAGEQRVLYRYRALVLVTLIVSFAKPVVGIVFVVLAEDKVTARILGLALVELIGYTGFFFIQMWRGKKFFSAKFWKHALRFNLPLIPHYLSQVVLGSSDRIMIKSMVGDSQAGIYSLAHNISLIMSLFNTALSQTISPWLYRKIKENKIKDIAPIAYISLTLIASVNLLLIALAPEAVAFFAPATYHEAIWVIPPVAMSVYFMYSYDLFAKFAFYYEKTNFIMIASLLGAGLNIVLNYICIGIWGYVAAGYTTLVCYIVYSVGHYIFMNKTCNRYCDGARPYELKKLFLITIPFLVMGFLLLLTYNYPILRYGLIAAAAIVAFVKRRQLVSLVKRVMAVKKR